MIHPGRRGASALVRPRPVGGSPLVRDYLSEVPRALSFYAGAPYDLASFRAKLAEVDRRFGPDERRVAAAALCPTSDAARQRLARFVEEGGAMVTTGQQAGFLTGPLYTIHKALSAVALARHLEERLGVIVLPVFWVASEDHDWAEVNHATLLDRKGRLHRFELPSPDPRPLPMSERRIEGDLDLLCDEISQVIGVADNTVNGINRIIDPYRANGRTVAEAFGDAIGGLFAGVDLLLTDAADPGLKRASLPVLERALTEAADEEAGLAARSAAISGAGYDTQVTILERGTNVFLRSESGRERLYRRDGHFMVRERPGRLRREEVLALLADEPGRFSPNVLLRPVVESTVFPTLAYVGGPGEIAYHAQAGALFEAHGISPPIVVPRYSALVVEPSTERLLEQLGLAADGLTEPKEELVDRLARREVPEKVNGSLGALRQDLADDFEKLIEEALRLDPTLAGALGAIRNRTLLAAGLAERKIVGAVKRGELVSLTRLERVLDALKPYGKPQDRVLNVLPYLARYGGHFLREAERSIQENWRLPEDG